MRVRCKNSWENLQSHQWSLSFYAHTSQQISSGGYIDFTGGLQFYPRAGSLGFGKIAVAPFWSSANGRAGSVYFSLRTDASTLQRANADIVEFDPTNGASFSASHVLVVTWVNMESFDGLPGVSHAFDHVTYPLIFCASHLVLELIVN